MGLVSWTPEAKKDVLQLILDNPPWRHALFGKALYRRHAKWKATRDLSLRVFGNDAEWIAEMSGLGLVKQVEGRLEATDKWNSQTHNSIQTLLHRLNKEMDDGLYLKKHQIDQAWTGFDDVPKSQRAAFEESCPYYFLLRELSSTDSPYVPRVNVTPAAVVVTSTASPPHPSGQAGSSSRSEGEKRKRNDLKVKEEPADLIDLNNEFPSSSGETGSWPEQAVIQTSKRRRLPSTPSPAPASFPPPASPPTPTPTPVAITHNDLDISSAQSPQSAESESGCDSGDNDEIGSHSQDLPGSPLTGSSACPSPSTVPVNPRSRLQRPSQFAESENGSGNDEESRLDNEESGFDNEESVFDNEESRFDNEESRFEENGYDNEESGFDNEESGFEENGFDNEESRFDNEESRFDNEESRFEENGYDNEQSGFGENGYDNEESGSDHGDDPGSPFMISSASRLPSPEPVELDPQHQQHHHPAAQSNSQSIHYNPAPEYTSDCE